MTDKRWTALGETLVNYSLGVKPGERLMIAMYEIESYPLALAVYTAAKAGGYAQMFKARRSSTPCSGTEATSRSPGAQRPTAGVGGSLPALRGAFNPTSATTSPPPRWAEGHGRHLHDAVAEDQRALIRVPNERFAQQAKVSYEKIIDMFFDACNLDWPAHVAHWQRVADRMNRGHRIRVVGRQTDFSFAYENETWKVSENRINIPDGEFFITPKWETVQGHIYFEFPPPGRQDHQRPELRVLEACRSEVSASSNQDFVEEILRKNEPGARRVGEFAFGTNPYIDVPTTDILWDEKIAGSIHIALGRPYNGDYDCPIHWDIVKDTRTESMIYLDDALIFEDGKFLI